MVCIHQKKIRVIKISGKEYMLGVYKLVKGIYILERSLDD